MTDSQNAEHNPLAVSFIEMATAIRTGTDHIHTKTPGPMPDPTYTHPEDAAAVATHTLALLAMHYYRTWEDLHAWLEDLTNTGLDGLNTPDHTNQEK